MNDSSFRYSNNRNNSWTVVFVRLLYVSLKSDNELFKPLLNVLIDCFYCDISILYILFFDILLFLWEVFCSIKANVVSIFPPVVSWCKPDRRFYRSLLLFFVVFLSFFFVLFAYLCKYPFGSFTCFQLGWN